jgi:hypothetical protein
LQYAWAYARAGLLALAVLLTGPAFLASPTSAHRGDTATPTPVAVDVEFVDNACVGDEYVPPSMNAPVVPGTTDVIIGAVAPGETVVVTYTALEGYVIEGPSTFTHTFPIEPDSARDCLQGERPDPLVRDRSKVRTDCGGVERREWQIVTPYVWNGTTWVLGEPEVRSDTGWVLVRGLTRTERERLGCPEVKGAEATAPHQDDGEAPQVRSDVDAAPTPDATQRVPGAVDAGLAHSVAAPAGPRWLAPLLSGVIVLGLAAFSRLKRVGRHG